MNRFAKTEKLGGARATGIFPLSFGRQPIGVRAGFNTPQADRKPARCEGILEGIQEIKDRRKVEVSHLNFLNICEKFENSCGAATEDSPRLEPWGTR
jgi:hypothetical protein